MDPWRIFLIAAVTAVLIPTVVLMNQVNALKEQNDQEALQRKQRKLTWCVRLLIAVFLVTLGITMYLHFSKLLAA